jgi:ribonuclease HI
LSFLEQTALSYKSLLVQICSFNNVQPNLNFDKLEIVPTIDKIRKNNLPKSYLKSISNQKIETDYEPFYKNFTDGSKTPKNSGCAFYDPREKKSFSFKLNPLFSIASSELIGILEALKYANNKSIKQLCLLTDSKSSCSLLISDSKMDDYIVNEIYIFLANSNFDKVVIQWIPSHVGIEGNEEADSAAKLSCYKSQIEGYGLTLGDAVLACKNDRLTLWNSLYRLTSEEKGTKLWMKLWIMFTLVFFLIFLQHYRNY